MSVRSPLVPLNRTVARIEARADQCLELCRGKLGLPRLPLPIPIEQFIEGPMEIRFGIEDLSRFGNGVLGAAFIREREILISDRIKHEGRFRFTCAHELGHMVLHGKGRVSFQDAEVPFPTSTNRFEREADRFAAGFLMPMPAVVVQIFRACEEYNLGWEDTVTELLRDTPDALWLWRERFLPSLVRDFAVSQTAAVIRLSDMRFEDGRSLLLPSLRQRLFERSAPPTPSVRAERGQPVFRRERSPKENE